MKSFVFPTIFKTTADEKIHEILFELSLGPFFQIRYRLYLYYFTVCVCFTFSQCKQKLGSRTSKWVLHRSLISTAQINGSASSSALGHRESDPFNLHLFFAVLKNERKTVCPGPDNNWPLAERKLSQND